MKSGAPKLTVKQELSELLRKNEGQIGSLVPIAS
jgi:hypothetical protein